MTVVDVNVSKHYKVLIGSGLLDSLGQEAAKVTKGRKVCLVSDSHVWPLYGEKAVQSLAQTGFETIHYTFSAGEESKNGSTYLTLINYLSENQLTRSDCLVALGGGVVGDLTGFAAATYLRGIAYIQVPTTLLAAVDSSVGGKTAIDLPAGKNLAGAFYQPNLVFCDIDTLDTLPEEIFRDGCAEVIKYGVLYDENLFAHLDETGLNFHREAVIARCVELKRDVVVQDEFDNGQRQKLNFGHTVGHAVEANSHFSISHGKAVAIGMAIVSRSSCAQGLCSAQTRDSIIRVIEKFGLPTYTSYDAGQLNAYALSDKKRSGGSVNMIVPSAIGLCRIHPTPIADIQSFIEAGL